MRSRRIGWNANWRSRSPTAGAAGEFGTLLVADMERRATSLGARRIAADSLRSNEPMKALARRTGFSIADVPSDARLVRIVKELTPSQTVLRPAQPGGGPDLPLAA